MKQAINIRLEKGVVEALDGYAAELDKSRTSLIEKAIELYFDTLDEMAGERRIDALKSGKSEVVSLEEVFEKAGINKCIKSPLTRKPKRSSYNLIRRRKSRWLQNY